MAATKKIDLLEIIQEIVNLNSKMRFAAIIDGVVKELKTKGPSTLKKAWDI